MRLVCCLIVALTIAGCNNPKIPVDPNLLAKVNGDKITVQQVQAEFAKLSSPTLKKESVRQMLSNLVDRQLLAQEAIKLNLDRSPEVVQVIESSKASIYAQAYLSKKMAKLNDVSEKEVTEYIHLHPERFKQRKLLKTHDVLFRADFSNLDIKRMEQEITTIKALEAELENKHVVYETHEGQILTDRLPSSLLSKVSLVQKGDLLFLHNDNSVIVKAVESVENLKMPLEIAISVAKQMIIQQKKEEFIKNDIERLRKLSTINIYDDNLVGNLH